MILLDANLLAHARVRNMTQHARAKAWLDGEINRGSRIGGMMKKTDRPVLKDQRFHKGRLSFIRTEGF